MDHQYTSINHDGPETPLIARRGATKEGTPKNLGYIPSIVYFILLTFGYPLINMSVVYYQAGVVPIVAFFIIFSLLSAFINVLFSDGIALLPGNEDYDLNLEYSGLAKVLFNKPGYYFFLIVYITYTLAANVGMGRVVAQCADDFIVLCSGHAYGIQFYPHLAAVEAPNSAYFYNNPDQLVIGITAGYGLAFLILTPMALFQLFGALWVQGIMICVVFFCCIEFVVFFGMQGLHQQVPLFGTTWTQVMGPIIFNLGVGGAMPLWLNQKRFAINTVKVVFGVSSCSMVLNIVLPLLGAYRYGSVLTSDLFELMTNINPTTLCRLAVYFYTITVVGCSIPINSITVKNNIYTELWSNVPFSMFVGVFVQVILGWLVLSGGLFSTFLNYVSLFLGGFSGFFFPLIMYWLLQKQYVARTGAPGSPLGFLPDFALRRWKAVTITCLCLTAIPTVAQVLIDFYFLIFLGKNVV